MQRDALKRLADGPIIDGEVKLAKKDGSAIWCRANGRGMAADNSFSGIFTLADAEERRASEQAVRTSELMYRNLVETSNDLIWTIGPTQCWTYVNAAAVRRIYGYDAEELLGQRFEAFSAESVRERDEAVLGRVLAGESVFEYETRHRARDGSLIELSLNAIPLRGVQGEITGATGTARDISEQKKAAAELYENIEKLRLAVEAADLRYWEWDGARDTPQRSEDAGRGPAAPPWFDRPGDDRWSIHPEDRERAGNARRAALERAEPHEIEYRLQSPDGETRWIASRGKALLNAAGAVYRITGVSQDITDRKRQEEEARFLAYHDMLTGLPNRRLFDDRLRQAVFTAQRHAAGIAVLAIDLDDFKQVNDSLGHRAGDAVLREAASRLAGCVRKSDTLARQGGDEFVILAPDLKSESDARFIAEKLLRSLEPEFPADGRRFRIGASIGISIYPADAQDSDSLMRNADVAMYRAKELGKNNFRFYGR